jgi:hypothetical protein
MALWKKVLIGVGVFFVAMMLLGLIVGEDAEEGGVALTETVTVEPDTPLQPEPEAAEVAESPATEPEPVPEPEPEGLSDEDIAREAEAFIKMNWGMGADQSWQSFECTAGMTCWQPYVVDFTFADGVVCHEDGTSVT